MAGKPFFIKPLPFGISSVSSALSSNPAVHLQEFQFPAMTWRTSATSGTHGIVIDFGGAAGFNHVAVLGANAGAATKIQIQADNTTPPFAAGTAAYIGATADFISPAVSGRPSYHSFTDLPSLAYRYLAINIFDHVGAFEAAKIIVGQKIESAKYYETQWQAGPADLSSVTENRNGVPDIAFGLMQRQISFNLGWMSESEWETSISPLLQACGKTEPVYCCFDPEATIYRQNRTYFGRLSESSAEKQGFNRFQKQFQIRSFY